MIKLNAKNSISARCEASKKYPKNDVKLFGYVNDECVYITLVRNVTKGYVATATKGIKPTRFEAEPV